MTGSDPEISVIVPHYQDLAALDSCLTMLERQTLARERFEIIVADNNSPIGREKVEEAIAGRARLVVVTEKGAGPARNGGVAAARGKLLAFTDSDCVPEPQWLEAGIGALARHDIVGGRVTVLVDDPKSPSAVEAFERVFAFNFEDYILNKGFTGSGNLFVPKETFEKVGGFRAAVSEDVDWSHRARALGFEIGYEPNAVVGHPARRTWSELHAKWARVSSESYLLMRPKPLGRLRWMARTWALPLSAIAHTPRVLRSRELPDGGAKMRALKTLYQIRLWRFVEGHRQLLKHRA